MKLDSVDKRFYEKEESPSRFLSQRPAWHSMRILQRGSPEFQDIMRGADQSYRQTQGKSMI